MLSQTMSPHIIEIDVPGRLKSQFSSQALFKLLSVDDFIVSYFTSLAEPSRVV